MISSSLLSAQDSGEPMFCDKPEAGKNHMIPYQDTCIRFMKTAEPFSYKKGFPPNHIVTISPVMGSMMTDI
jgi:hypothetical protein